MFKANERTALQTRLRLHEEDIKLAQRNEIIAKGTLKHFAPTNGVYVYERKYNGKSVVVIFSGSDSEKTINLATYKEILPKNKAKDIISENIINLDGETLTIKPRSVFILEF
jgi:Cyclo-malto-dextrinase C-terminal domain.